MRKLLPLILVPFLLVGCGSISDGVVINKSHEKARYYEEYDFCKDRYPVTRTRSRTDSDGRLRTEVYTDYECRGGYVTRYDDEDWLIQIEKCKESGDPSIVDENGKSSYNKSCKRNWLKISESQYNSVNTGDYYGREND